MRIPPSKPMKIGASITALLVFQEFNLHLLKLICILNRSFAWVHSPAGYDVALTRRRSRVRIPVDPPPILGLK